MLFEDLVSAELPADLHPVVEELLRAKREMPEFGTGPQIPEINNFIREQMEMMKIVADNAEYQKNDKEELEEFFLRAVMPDAAE